MYFCKQVLNLAVVNYRAIIADNLKVAYESVRANGLRSILTVLIISFGIMALVGILTAIESIDNTVSQQFATMGTNTFTIRSRGFSVYIGNTRIRKRNYSYISYREANEFKNRFDFPANVSVTVNASGSAVIKYRSQKTNPNVQVAGSDENYLSTAGLEIEAGRNITRQDVNVNANVVLLGADLVSKLFLEDEDPLNKQIIIGSVRYMVIGVLKRKGSSMGSNDNVCIIPYTNVRYFFSRPNQNYSINITPHNPLHGDLAEGYAESVFRSVRGLRPSDVSDFNIIRSDLYAAIFRDVTGAVLLAATMIGVVTLFGAAIGLMNIMLVSVTERTVEIGVRKAIGAKSSVIKMQFLFEAILICQFGGLLGIVLGIFTGNIVSLIMKSDFLIPWIWIIAGIVLCLIVGIVSGYYPAVKASRLDPIIALRHE